MLCVSRAPCARIMNSAAAGYRHKNWESESLRRWRFLVFFFFHWWQIGTQQLSTSLVRKVRVKAARKLNRSRKKTRRFLFWPRFRIQAALIFYFANYKRKIIIRQENQSRTQTRKNYGRKCKKTSSSLRPEKTFQVRSLNTHYPGW